MFAKGKIRGNGAQLARYLMTGEDGEKVVLIDTHGLEAFGSDPVAAFAALQDIADANTRATKPFFTGISGCQLTSGWPMRNGCRRLS
jgi:hypothetical protein